MADVASTNNSSLVFALNSANTTNATSVKASAGVLHFIHVHNASATVPAYVKLYDSASAPTVGTTVPKMVITVPAQAGTTTGNISSQTFAIPNGVRFANGIALSVNGGAADTDTTAVATAQVKVLLTYK